ncbi:transmembrane protein 220-like isoform X1 [Centruroides sculpturatus]|uniref:transmembrane protein 220-like isoform X1 n=1 Tax=Centruroides sculpturatus TaxID=218467 RepID=UPI000C6EBAA2|nr:transmembrane protein 220-like isoform X1 [Centruroides sculpturatus]
MSFQRRQIIKSSSDESENDDVNSSKDDSLPLLRSTNTKTWSSWRWINTFMGIFFAFEAYLQIDDPDWYLWITVYTIPSLLTFSVALYPAILGNIFWRVMCSVTFAFSVGFSIYLLIEFARVLQPRLGFNPMFYEEGREFLGVLIIAIWLQACRESKFAAHNSS